LGVKYGLFSVTGGLKMSKLEYPRPQGLLHNPALSQVVVASGARMILTAPQALRSRFANVWPSVVEHAVTVGIARFDDKGTLHVVKE